MSYPCSVCSGGCSVGGVPGGFKALATAQIASAIRRISVTIGSGFDLAVLAGLRMMFPYSITTTGTRLMRALRTISAVPLPPRNAITIPGALVSISALRIGPAARLP